MACAVLTGGVVLKEDDQMMIENSHTTDWFVWGMQSTDPPGAPDALLLMVELRAVKEMINMFARGDITGQEFHDAMDTFAQWVSPPGSRNGYAEREINGYDCPHGCAVCADARAEFDAIATESFMYKMRLADPDRHPYAAGKNTLHRSNCPRVARYVGPAEPVGSPWSLAGLPAFAHHGVFSTTWAAGMRVMTAEETSEWVRWHNDPRHGMGFKLCCYCLSPVPVAVMDGENVFDVSYQPAETVVTWG